MFGIEKTKNNISSDKLEKVGKELGFIEKYSIKYPCRNKDGTIDYLPLWELSEQYKLNQIRYHSNRISESQYLLSLLK